MIIVSNTCCLLQWFTSRKTCCKMEWIELFFPLCLHIHVLRLYRLNWIALLLNHWFCIEKSNTAGRFESFKRKNKTLFSQFANFDCFWMAYTTPIWATYVETDGAWCLFLTPNWRKIDRDAMTLSLCWTTDVFRDFSLWNFLVFFFSISISIRWQLHKIVWINHKSQPMLTKEKSNTFNRN